jgi:putative phage-type endonuclease
MEGNMEQGSEYWLQFRKRKIGSSDAPVIMLAEGAFSTPYKLWCDKTGRTDAYLSRPLKSNKSGSNWAMDRGNKFEPIARALYELDNDIELAAAVLVHPDYPFLIASLDGYNKEAGIILEIKIPGAEVFELAKGGKVHPKYIPQLQHQLMVTGAKEAHFFCCKVERVKGEEKIVDQALVIVPPDLNYQKELLFQELQFQGFVDNDIAPPLTTKDTLVLEDESTVVLMSRLKKHKTKLNFLDNKISALIKEMNAAEEEFAQLRDEAIEHIEPYSHPKVFSVGVNATLSKTGAWTFRFDNDDHAEGSESHSLDHATGLPSRHLLDPSA